MDTSHSLGEMSANTFLAPSISLRLRVWHADNARGWCQEYNHGLASEFQSEGFKDWFVQPVLSRQSNEASYYDTYIPVEVCIT